jgi:hypothetical protein
MTMKKLNASYNEAKGQIAGERSMINGVRDITGYVKSVAETMMSGTGSLRIFALGLGIFGFARLLGMLVGYISA